jgi:hypothetical protein
MQNGRGLPSHPSLPRAPHLMHHAAQAITSPYQQHQQSQAAYAQYSFSSTTYQHYVSSHYAQAYMQGHPPAGKPAAPQAQYYVPVPDPSTRSSTSQPSSRWAEPGNVRCRKLGCTFTGSHESVEIHMMDRHLIYPPGWENRKRKADWDADPSLKGCVPHHITT